MSNKPEVAAENEKTVIRPDVSNYQSARSASGSKSMHNGDAVACALVGATLAEVVKLGAEVLECTQKELTEKYAKLNIGQQRMNIGNRIRGVVNKMNKAEEGVGDKFITELASGVREAVDKRMAAETAEKEAKVKAAAEAKAKKEADKAAKAEKAAATKAAAAEKKATKKAA